MPEMLQMQMREKLHMRRQALKCPAAEKPCPLKGQKTQDEIGIDLLQSVVMRVGWA
ncbi:MAG: hypothetical protein JNM70_02010 [Anaerolineae bacterium]|nr:hypothetical protein [Anaerolineae bacterium]